MTDGEQHRRHQEDLAAYLLDALAPEEKRAFETHLASCPACQAEERWLRGAIELLPSSVEQFEPPPELRSRLMETVRGESASDPAAAWRGISDRAPRRERRFFAPMLRPATAALASAAILAAGVAGYLIGNEDGGGETETVAAQPTPAGPGARASVVRSGDTAVLRVDRLPPTERGRVYQVWLDRGERGIEPSSLFTVNREGRGAAGIAGDLDGVRAVMVSEEPAGGSTKPSSDPVLRAPL